jgi:hypothetical protein
MCNGYNVYLIFPSGWREFSLAPCPARKKTLRARISMLMKSRASPYMLPFSLCDKKRLAIRHMNSPIFPKTLINSVLHHQEVGQINDLSVPTRRAELFKLAPIGPERCQIVKYFIYLPYLYQPKFL